LAGAPGLGLTGRAYWEQFPMLQFGVGGAQAIPQPPQLSTSSKVSTQSAPHCV